MGIRGLETLIYSNNLHETVRIRDAAARARKKNPKLNPIAVVDGNNTSRFLYRSDRLRGGEWQYTEKILAKFIEGLQRDVGKVVIFFTLSDFPSRSTSAEEGLVAKQKFFWDSVAFDEKEFSTWFLDKLRALEQARHDTVDVEDKAHFNTVVPSSQEIVPLMIQALNKDVEIRYAPQKAHTLASYARANSAAVLLGQHTEYIMYDLPCVYLSLRHLDVESMSTVQYDPARLAHFLGVDTSVLPLVGTLCGNQDCPATLLEELHRHVTGKRRGKPPWLPEYIGPVARACRLLEGTTGQEIAICLRASLGVWVPGDVIQRSLDVYRLDASLDVPEPDSDLYRRAKDRFQTGYDTAFLLSILRGFPIIQRGRYLEPLATCANFHPATSLEVFKDLILGLLSIALPAAGLKTVPMHVLWNRNKDGRRPLTLEPPGSIGGEPAPPLAHLWDPECDPDLRWRTLAGLVDPGWEVEELRALEHRLVVPVCVLRYLHLYGRRNQRPVTEQETRAFLTTALLMANGADDQTPKHPLQLRVTYVTNLYLMGVLYVLHALTICGWPLEPRLALPQRYFDGRVFHHQLHQIEQGETAEQSDLFDRVWRLITE